MEVFISNLSYISTIIGLAVIGMVLYCSACMLLSKIKSIINRQSKIRCLCKHKYEFKWRWFNQENSEYTYRCVKCGKILKINVINETEK